VVLSKRERHIGIVCAAVLALLLLDYGVVEPLMAQKDDLDQQIAKQSQELDKAHQLQTNSRRMTRIWTQLAGNQLQRNTSEAESQLLHNVDDWAHDAGLNLASSRASTTAEREKDFNKITVRAIGNGGMSQIGRFLWHVQVATSPVRVTELTLSSKKDGIDDLTMQVAISTIQQAAADQTKPAAPAPAPEVQQ
jgi:hypothetical protein